MDLSPLIEYCKKQEILLTEEHVKQIDVFGERLYELNKSMNLTRVPYEDCALRHFVDSMLVSEFIADETTVLDVGSGPGFPSWILACIRPSLKVTAMDSTGKMLKILRELPLDNLEIKEQRAEDADCYGEFDVVTGRAVARLSIQLEISAPWAAVGGGVVPFRTPFDDPAIQSFDASQLGLELESIEERELPGTDVIRIFPLYRKTAKTPQQYPRSWTQIKKSPL